MGELLQDIAHDVGADNVLYDEVKGLQLSTKEAVDEAFLSGRSS